MFLLPYYEANLKRLRTKKRTLGVAEKKKMSRKKRRENIPLNKSVYSDKLYIRILLENIEEE